MLHLKRDTNSVEELDILGAAEHGVHGSVWCWQKSFLPVILAVAKVLLVKELNFHLGKVGRGEAREPQALPRAGSAAAKDRTTVTMSNYPGSAAA